MMFDMFNDCQTHEEALQQASQRITILSQDLSNDNLRELMKISEAIKNIAHCHYAEHYHLPPIEVDSKDFRENPSKWSDIAKDRTVRVVRDGKSFLSFSTMDWLDDPFSWCSVCGCMANDKYEKDV